MNRLEHANQITNTLYSVMNSNTNGHLELKKLLEGILEKLSQICGILSSAMKEEKPEPKAEAKPVQETVSKEPDLFTFRTKNHYPGLKSAYVMAQRVNKRERDIRRIAKEKNLYSEVHNHHLFVREIDEIYYR